MFADRHVPSYFPLIANFVKSMLQFVLSTVLITICFILVLNNDEFGSEEHFQTDFYLAVSSTGILTSLFVLEGFWNLAIKWSSAKQNFYGLIKGKWILILCEIFFAYLNLISLSPITLGLLISSRCPPGLTAMTQVLLIIFITIATGSHLSQYPYREPRKYDDQECNIDEKVRDLTEDHGAASIVTEDQIRHAKVNLRKASADTLDSNFKSFEMPEIHLDMNTFNASKFSNVNTTASGKKIEVESEEKIQYVRKIEIVEDLVSRSSETFTCQSFRSENLHDDFGRNVRSPGDTSEDFSIRNNNKMSARSTDLQEKTPLMSINVIDDSEFLANSSLASQVFEEEEEESEAQFEVERSALKPTLKVPSPTLEISGNFALESQKKKPHSDDNLI